MAGDASHPSNLALERLLAGESHDCEEHVKGCETCRERVSALEAQGAQFRRTLHAARARNAFASADHRWRVRLMQTALVPAAVALAAVAALLTQPRVPVAPLAAGATAAPPKGAGRTPGRSLLEPRGGEGPVRLREVSLRGMQVGFGGGVLEAANEDDETGPTGPFVLKHTAVDATVSGLVARVQVTQEFENPFRDRVEAIYVFPLPDNAAVDDLTLVVGQRVIKAAIKKREEARRDYEEAKSQGRRAALLDQERPNIFTQSVANIMPGDKVRVVIRYVAPLKYDDGSFEFNFPMVVGPRYIPGAALPGASQGTGTAADSVRVPDASRITPKTLPPGQRSGRDISIKLHLDAGLPIEDLASVSHRIWVDRPSTREAEIELNADDRVPNKDLVVRWKVAGRELRSALMATRGAGGGYFALMFQPPASEAFAPVVPKEMVFVIDTSGSMTGEPLQAEKSFMRQALKAMNPDDTFTLVDFSDSASTFHPSPLANTPRNVERALAYLDALPAGGGTNQLAGIRAALVPRTDPSRLRTVLFMTDGFIGNEEEILAEVERTLGDARLFSFGVGSSVNHYLLARLAEVGRGFYQYVRADEDQGEAIERFVRRIAKPLVTDLEIDWGGLVVSEVLPRKIPDLFDQQPVIVLGKYEQPGRAQVVVHGRTGRMSRSTELEVELPERQEEHQAIATLWARARIEELERQQYRGEQADLVRQITSLGLEHRLMTRYTSFIAVDQSPVANPDSKIVTVPVAVDLPDGVTMGEGRYGQRQAGDRTIPFDGKKAGGKQGTLQPRSGGDTGLETTVGPKQPPKQKQPEQPIRGKTETLSWRPEGSSYHSTDGQDPAPVATKPPTRGVDDDFDKIFGPDRGAKQPAAQPAPKDKPKTVYIPPAPGRGTGEETISVGVGGQRVINVPGVARIAIGDPSMADVKPLGSTQLLIVGQQEGETTLLIWKADGSRVTYRVDTRAPGNKTVYIPPAAGSGSAPSKVQLEQSDIMSVVVENKAMIKACADVAKATDPTATGTIVMRWTILPNGGVSNIQTVTEEFRKTPISACLSAGIRKFRFPAYSGPQMAPVNFPFKF
ncbi:MAG TPA: VIT domain-containing protein [Myxococcales bacterium]|jgi:Ca-activated chloride channel family protein